MLNFCTIVDAWNESLSSVNNEQLSGMKINYEKSEMMCIGMEEEEINQFTRLFCRKKKEIFPSNT